MLSSQKLSKWSFLYPQHLCVFVAFSFILLTAQLSHAADISIGLHVEARDEQVTVTISNTGKDPAPDPIMRLELDGQELVQRLPAPLLPGTGITIHSQLALPSREGSFPLVTTFSYLNDKSRLSVKNVGYFNHRRHDELGVQCTLQTTRLHSNGELRVACDESYPLRLILPDEIIAKLKSDSGKERVFSLKNTASEFRSNYAIYAIIETPKTIPVAAMKIFESRLLTSRDVKAEGLLTKNCLLVTMVAGFFLSAVIFSLSIRNSGGVLTRISISLIRASFTITTVSALLWGAYALGGISDIVLPLIHNSVLSHSDLGRGMAVCLGGIFEWFYFEGGDYDYFFQYLALPLFLYVLFLNVFVLFFVIRPDEKSDKFFHLILALFSRLPILRNFVKSYLDAGGTYSPALSRLAVLTLMVKVFYVPLLCSWTINNLIHQRMLMEKLSWNFDSINEFLLALFILLDVAIFAFGYLVELPQLKNGIRSVEPTVLGWIVCLVCYPPFNQLAFLWIDIPLHEYWSPVTGYGGKIVTALITALWGIYLWATIALGSKASNLTNRGTVSTGPYSYVRHPAYAAKVTLWIISGIFLAEKNFFLVLSLAIIYALRAWTEERHLSQDSEYREYKSRVRWKALPGVF